MIMDYYYLIFLLLAVAAVFLICLIYKKRKAGAKISDIKFLIILFFVDIFSLLVMNIFVGFLA